MTSMLGSFRALSAPARLLVVNQLGINAGFYLVLPFLAVYLGSLGYAAATIGLVLALRNLSLVSAAAVAGTNPATGALLGWSVPAGVPWVPFTALAGVGLTGVAAVAAMQRRGLLDEGSAETPRARRPAGTAEAES